jgi:hypothetical protein
LVWLPVMVLATALRVPGAQAASRSPPSVTPEAFRPAETWIVRASHGHPDADATSMLTKPRSHSIQKEVRYDSLFAAILSRNRDDDPLPLDGPRWFFSKSTISTSHLMFPPPSARSSVPMTGGTTTGWASSTGRPGPASGCRRRRTGAGAGSRRRCPSGSPTIAGECVRRWLHA